LRAGAGRLRGTLGHGCVMSISPRGREVRKNSGGFDNFPQPVRYICTTSLASIATTFMADPIPLSAQRLALQGLPLRLIQDGLLDERAMIEATIAAKESGTNLVSHLVANGLADP